MLSRKEGNSSDLRKFLLLSSLIYNIYRYASIYKRKYIVLDYNLLIKMYLSILKTILSTKILEHLLPMRKFHQT